MRSIRVARMECKRAEGYLQCYNQQYSTTHNAMQKRCICTTSKSLFVTSCGTAGQLGSWHIVRSLLMAQRQHLFLISHSGCPNYCLRVSGPTQNIVTLTLCTSHLEIIIDVNMMSYMKWNWFYQRIIDLYQNIQCLTPCFDETLCDDVLNAVLWVWPCS